MNGGAMGMGLNNFLTNRAASGSGGVDFTETLALAKSSMKDTSRLLSVSFLASRTIETPGNTTLEAPKKLTEDANLQLAKLQDALNQLTQQVSVHDIKQNLQTSNEANKKQLQDMQDAAKAHAAEQAKAQEEAKKSNVFAAISNWVQAAVTLITMAVTVLAAVAQAVAGNALSAGALFLAAGAMAVQAVGQIVLAIDATMAATSADGKGFLSPEAKATVEKMVEIAGYVALACSMIGMIGGLVSAAGKASTQVAGQIAKTGAQQAGSKAAQMTGEITKETVRAMTKEAFKEAAKEITKMSMRIGMGAAVGKIGQASINAAGAEIVGDIKLEKAAFGLEAEKKKADAQEMAALVAKLRGMLEQLQQAMEEQMDKGENVMQSLLAPITDRMKTMQSLVQNLGV